MFRKLAHMSPALHSTAHHIVEPMDMKVSRRHLAITYCSMKHSDKAIMGMTTSGRNAEDVMLHGLTRAVAAGRSTEVRCNAVAPGWIDTDLSEAFVDPMPDPVAFRHDSDRIHPVGRTGKPEEVAALMARLTSDGAAFVTGQVWTMGGGRMAKLSLPH